MSDKLVIAATPGTTWPLDLDTAETKIRERFPGVVTSRHIGATTGLEYVSFDVEIDDMMRHGIYVDGGNLTLSDGTPADWADTIAWFLSLLPPGTEAVALSEQNGELAYIPPNASAEQLQSILDRLTMGS
jgi:hypothetical protein